jgi:2-hydroxy-6-oxonona-2,4-dienedioate hydrolase
MITRRRDLLKAAAASVALPLIGSAAEAAPKPKSYDSKLMGEPKFIDVDGIRTRYFEGGAGEAMVLVHGGQWPATASADGWAAIFDHLAEHFHVYAFDKLGMGFTDLPKSDADFSMDAVNRHTAGFVKALGLSKLVMVGHSRGALPAARFVVDHPDLVSHFVIFDTNALASDNIKMAERSDPPPLKEPPTREKLREESMRSPLSYRKDFITDAYIEAQFRIASLPKTQEADRRFRAAKEKWIRDNPAKMKEDPRLGNNTGAVAWWMIDSKHETLDLIRAGKLKAPTIMIWGWNDAFAPYTLGLDAMETISKVVERAELHMINHASHFVFAEHPEEATRLIVNFVEG